MSTFLQVAQSLTVALKALQMYTAAHPRAQQSLSMAQIALEDWLEHTLQLQFVATGAKAFVDGELLDTKVPQIANLAKLVTERAISGFIVERGVTEEDLLSFLQGLALKPQRLEEAGGFEAFLRTAGVRHIKVSQTRYQEISEGEHAAKGQEKAPLFNPATPAKAPGSQAKVGGADAKPGAGPKAGEGQTGADGKVAANAAAKATPKAHLTAEALLKLFQDAVQISPDLDLGPANPSYGEDDGVLGFLKRVSPADLSGLGPMGREMGLGEGMPTPAQLGTLRQALMGLSPEVQMNLLAGLSSLPGQPAGLAMGLKALAGEVLASAASTAMAKGATWAQLRGPIKDILRPLANRDSMVRTLAARLHAAGLDSAQADFLLRQLEWEDLSLEAKRVKVLDGGELLELSQEQRLALLRELLDTRRFDDFMRVQEVLLHMLGHEQPAYRIKAVQTLAGIARWAQDPGLPREAEGSLSEGLRANFAWEPDPPIHRWTTEALEFLLTSLVERGEFGHVMADLQELEDLTTFLEGQHPWRNQAIDQLRQALTRPLLLDAVIDHIFTMPREQAIEQIYPYLDFLNEPMALHLVDRLGSEKDRTHRGRLVEAARSLGPVALPALMSALDASAWFLVRNALTILSDLGDAGCVPAIIPLLRHPEPRVRRTAVRALYKLGGPVAEPHLVARIKDTDGDTLQEILFVLAQLRSESSLAPVAELAQDKRVVEKLRIQALDTLAHIASPRALPVIMECLKRKTFFSAGESPAIRLAAAKALAALATPEARAAFKKLVDSEPKGEAREAMLRFLDQPVQQ